MTRSAIAHYHEERLALSKFNIAAILRSEGVANLVRRELRRAYPNINPGVEQLGLLIEAEVLKREVVEGDKAAAAMRLMKRTNRPLRKTKAQAVGARERQPSAESDDFDALP